MSTPATRRTTQDSACRPRLDLRRKHHRRQRKQHHHGYVLQQQGANRELAVRRVRLVVTCQFLDHDRRAGERDADAQDDEPRMEPLPSAATRPLKIAAVMAICAAPPNTMCRHVRRSPDTEKSRPAVKSSSAMPISASSSTSACAPTMRSPAGPLTIRQNQGDDRRHPYTAGHDQQCQRNGVDENDFLKQRAVGHLIRYPLTVYR